MGRRGVRDRSALFIAGVAGSLMPQLFGGHHRMSLFAEACYLLGALLYTASIYGQVFESMNADVRIRSDRTSQVPEKFRWFAFEPWRLEFLTPFVLLIGSLVFNFAAARSRRLPGASARSPEGDGTSAPQPAWSGFGTVP
ncbi:hypothetical protein [Parasphingorhabdus pacifica]